MHSLRRWGWAIVVGVLTANVLSIAPSYVVAPHGPVLISTTSRPRSLFSLGRWMFLTGLFTVAAEGLLRGVVSHTLGTAALGVFDLALRLVMIPIQVVEGAAGTVALRAHVELGDDAARQVRGLQTSLVALLAVLAPVYAVLTVVSGGPHNYWVRSWWARDHAEHGG